MNLPNKLTLLRIILVPVFIAVAAIGFPGWNYVAAVVFFAASLTDSLDGKIAPKTEHRHRFRQTGGSHRR